MNQRKIKTLPIKIYQRLIA